MNKYQEALNTLLNYAHENPNVGWVLIHEENTLQELVDKEKPMKPIVKIQTELRYVDCPNCNDGYAHEYVENKTYSNNNYCSNCGVKFDWTDGN